MTDGGVDLPPEQLVGFTSDNIMLPDLTYGKIILPFYSPLHYFYPRSRVKGGILMLPSAANLWVKLHLQNLFIRQITLLAPFGKSHPMAAVVGRANLMEACNMAGNLTKAVMQQRSGEWPIECVKPQRPQGFKRFFSMGSVCSVAKKAFTHIFSHSRDLVCIILKPNGSILSSN